MSCIDKIICKIPLPGDVPDFLKKNPIFQTSDLGKKQSVFVLENDQLFIDPNYDFILQMLQELADRIEQMPLLPINYKRKRIVMHASNLLGGKPSKKGYQWYTEDGSDKIDIDYVVQIRNNRVSSIKELSRKVSSAKHFKDF